MHAAKTLLWLDENIKYKYWFIKLSKTQKAAVVTDLLGSDTRPSDPCDPVYTKMLKHPIINRLGFSQFKITATPVTDSMTNHTKEQ
jgi:hypothetical protein